MTILNLKFLSRSEHNYFELEVFVTIYVNVGGGYGVAVVIGDDNTFTRIS